MMPLESAREDRDCRAGVGVGVGVEVEVEVELD